MYVHKCVNVLKLPTQYKNYEEAFNVIKFVYQNKLTTYCNLYTEY